MGNDLLSDIVPGSSHNMHSPAIHCLSLYETIQGFQDSVRMMGPEDPQITLIHNALYHLSSYTVPRIEGNVNSMYNS